MFKRENYVSLLINFDEQMLAEKLRSLLKFGSFSTRYKDVYDIYYLKDVIDPEKLLIALDTYIFKDPSMRENTGADLTKRLQGIFSDRAYIRRLDLSDNRWLDEDIGTITGEFWIS